MKCFTHEEENCPYPGCRKVETTVQTRCTVCRGLKSKPNTIRTGDPMTAFDGLRPCWDNFHTPQAFETKPYELPVSSSKERDEREDDPIMAKTPLPKEGKTPTWALFLDSVHEHALMENKWRDSERLVQQLLTRVSPKINMVKLVAEEIDMVKLAECLWDSPLPDRNRVDFRTALGDVMDLTTKDSTDARIRYPESHVADLEAKLQSARMSADLSATELEKSVTEAEHKAGTDETYRLAYLRGRATAMEEAARKFCEFAIQQGWDFPAVEIAAACDSIRALAPLDPMLVAVEKSEHVNENGAKWRDEALELRKMVAEMGAAAIRDL